MQVVAVAARAVPRVLRQLERLAVGLPAKGTPRSLRHSLARARVCGLSARAYVELGAVQVYKQLERKIIGMVTALLEVELVDLLLPLRRPACFGIIPIWASECPPHGPSLQVQRSAISLNKVATFLNTTSGQARLSPIAYPLHTR